MFGTTPSLLAALHLANSRSELELSACSLQTSLLYTAQLRQTDRHRQWWIPRSQRKSGSHKVALKAQTQKNGKFHFCDIKPRPQKLGRLVHYFFFDAEAAGWINQSSGERPSGRAFESRSCHSKHNLLHPFLLVYRARFVSQFCVLIIRLCIYA